MARGGLAIRVDVAGASELADRCLRVDDTFADAIAPATRQIAALVAGAARARAPVLTGALRATIAPETEQRSPTVGGVAWGTEYGGVIHFGWPRRNIAAQPFARDAARATRPQWEAILDRAIMATVDRTAG